MRRAVAVPAGIAMPMAVACRTGPFRQLTPVRADGMWVRAALASPITLTRLITPARVAGI